tara:strand:+ start:912 stop:1454 length:543 start_codon:yes stop_codon:yes gene_type:complete
MTETTKTKRTVTRRERFKPGFDEESGVRRTKINDREKTHTPKAENLIVEFELPTEFTRRDTKGGDGSGNNGGIPYQEYQLPINDGYVLINSFLGEEVAGTAVIAKVKVGEKQIRRKGKPPFKVYYLKFEPSNEAPDHELAVAPHDLALEDRIADMGGDTIIFHLSDYNDKHQGAILVKPL